MTFISPCDDKLRERATQLYFAADQSQGAVLTKIRHTLKSEGYDVPTATLRAWKARYWQYGRMPPVASRVLTERTMLPEGKTIALDRLSLSIIIAADRICTRTLRQVDGLLVTSAADVAALASSIQTLANASQIIAKAANEARAGEAKTINGEMEGELMPPERSVLGSLAAYDN